MISIEFFFFAFVIILFVSIWILNDAISVLKKNKLPQEGENELKEDLIFTWYSVLVIFVLSLMIYFGYPVLVKKGLDGHVMEWVNLVVRWAHVVFGIAWIGASFYFIFLENSLNRTKDLRDELAGNLWAIHGGGFYYIEKYKGAPFGNAQGNAKQFPEKLHWFKYEAYFTWVTGFILLILVYYLNAQTFLIDPAVSNISAAAAIFLGLGSLICGWLIYDMMCRSSLLKKPKLFGIVGLFIVIFFSYFLSKFLSGRAAFMHVGALLGTIMVGNVFFTIIPSQKDLVRAAKLNLPPDFEKGKYAGLRSLHNNYITLPVIFVMISNHFPGTFAPVFNWAILGILIIGSVAVRHYINMYEKGINSVWVLGFAAIALFAAVFVTSPKIKNPEKTISSNAKVDNTPVKFAQVQKIISARCISCHSKNPTDDFQKVPPNGIMFDNPQQIVKMSDRIFFRAVQTETMPQGNKTGITPGERELLGRWIKQGSLLN